MLFSYLSSKTNSETVFLTHHLSYVIRTIYSPFDSIRPQTSDGHETAQYNDEEREIFESLAAVLRAHEFDSYSDVHSVGDSAKNEHIINMNSGKIHFKLKILEMLASINQLILSFNLQKMTKSMRLVWSYLRI